MRDSANWQTHPQGDEVVEVPSGAIDLILQAGEVERTVSLRPNNACIVPKGIWHRIIVQKPANVLSITPSLGMQQRGEEAAAEVKR